MIEPQRALRLNVGFVVAGGRFLQNWPIKFLNIILLLRLLRWRKLQFLLTLRELRQINFYNRMNDGDV